MASIVATNWREEISGSEIMTRIYKLFSKLDREGQAKVRLSGSVAQTSHEFLEFGDGTARWVRKDTIASPAVVVWKN